MKRMTRGAIDKSRKIQTEVSKKKLMPKIDFRWSGPEINGVPTERKLTKIQKNERDKLVSTWNEWNDARNENIDNTINFRNLMTRMLGKQTMPEINKKEWINLFEKDRWNNIDQWKIEKIKNDEFYLHTFVDMFCKKGKEYYAFDVKYKTFNKDINQLNKFYVTNNEVLSYNRIQSTKKEVKLKIMIIIKEGKETFYRIFDWSDFAVPKKFNPHTQRKTSIRLKDGLKLQTFTKF